MCSNTNTSILALGLFLLVALDSFTTTTAIWPVPPKVTVQVRNLLLSKDVIRIHCKDKGNDLGVKPLLYREAFKFSFWPKFWGVSQWYCSFQWYTESQWFDIYEQWRDDKTCVKFCDWVVYDTGPCLHKPDGSEFDKCFPWNKKKNNKNNQTSIP